MHEVAFDRGEVIFSEGDPGDHCYKITSGKVEIIINVRGVLKRGRKETLGTCGPGEFIGDMSVMAGGPRSASAVAVEPTRCMAYSSEEILHILQSDPQEALAYVRMLIRRLRQSNRRMAWAATRGG